MNMEEITKELSQKTDTKIVLLVMDGLGGLANGGKTELEQARTPHLDALAAESVCGLTDPVSPGITPGSGPAHMALFGYDPTRYILGRGILEALGVDIPVGPDDLVARGNFATMEDGTITDRRAGRISTEKNEALCRRINQALPLDSPVRIRLYPGKEHRFVARFTGKGLSDALSDADPQKDHNPATLTQPIHEEARASAEIVNDFIRQAAHILTDEPKANSVLMRGFAKHPSLPAMQDLYKLKPAAIASYPMYRGLAKLVGMDVLEVGPETRDLFQVLAESYAHHDFFYIHYKKTDSAGEDGDFHRKIEAIEECDALIPEIIKLAPDVLAVTADHSTPSQLKGHSWHPNPLLIRAASAQKDEVRCFSERECVKGYLGRFAAVHVMPLLLAHAGKLKKFGA